MTPLLLAGAVTGTAAGAGAVFSLVVLTQCAAVNSLRDPRWLLRIEDQARTRRKSQAQAARVQAPGSAEATELAKQRRDHLSAASRAADLKARTASTIEQAEAEDNKDLAQAMKKVRACMLGGSD